MKTYEMKTYDETARTVFARMETQIEKNKKRNRVIRTVAAFTCFAVFAVTAVFGVKAMMRPGTTTNENAKSKKLVASLLKNESDEHAVTSGQGDTAKPSQIENYYDEKAPKSATVTVDGKEYNGTYFTTYPSNSANIEYYPVDAHSYIVYEDENDRKIAFFLNAENGELMMFSSFGPDDMKEPKNPESNKAIAANYAALFLGEHVDDYVMETGMSQWGYYWEYYRVIDGYKTTDRLFIVIDDDGQLVRLETGYLGTFNDIYSLPFSMEDAESTAKEMIAEIGDGAQYEFNKIFPTVLKDGSIGVIYYVLFPAKGSHYWIIVSFDE